MVKKDYVPSSVTCHQQLHSTSRNAAARRQSYSVRTLGASHGRRGGKNEKKKEKIILIWEGKSDVAKKKFKPPLKIETLATVCTRYGVNKASADPVPCSEPYPISLRTQRLSQTRLHPSYPLHKQASALQQRRPCRPARRRSY